MLKILAILSVIAIASLFGVIVAICKSSAIYEGPDECYDCNKTTCTGCPIMEEDQ